MRLKEIETRLAEIKDLIVADGADVDALAAETDALMEERAKLLAEIETRKATLEKVAKIPTEDGEGVKPMGEVRTFGIETVEYRNAWLKSLQGKQLSEVEQRSYAATDSDNAIPTMVADKFFEKMKKVAPMLSEITLMRVAGNLKFIAEGTRNTAAKHTENSASSAAADTVVSVTLGSFEFMKLIQISRNAQNMSVDAFEAWLVAMLGEDIARAIDDYIINDSTNGIAAITYTTGVTQIVNTATTGYTYKNVVDLIALLPAAYDAEAKFLVNKKTLYGQVANITDKQDRPIFVESAEAGVAGRIMGYPVVVDDFVATANNGLYLGKWTDVVGNLSQDVLVEKDASAGFTSNSVMFRGTANFDSKPAKTDGIVRLVSTTA